MGLPTLFCMRNLNCAALVLALLGGCLPSYGRQEAPAPVPALPSTCSQVSWAEFARRVAATMPYRLYFVPAAMDSSRMPLAATTPPVSEVLGQPRVRKSHLAGASAQQQSAHCGVGVGAAPLKALLFSTKMT